MYDEDDNIMEPTELKTIKFNKSLAPIVLAVYYSNLFYWYTYTFSDCRNINKPEVENFLISLDSIDNTLFGKLSSLSQRLSKDLQDNSDFLEYNYSSGRRRFQAFYARKSKPIIDEIDKVLAKHYGFTEEELDFIINYDIKYRMGDELGEEANSEPQPEKPQPAKPRQKPVEQKPEPKDNMLNMIVGKETIERIKSGEKTTFKRYLDDEEFAKQVLVTENGRIKLSNDHCPYTAKNITSIKLVCDSESLVKPVTKISFRTGINQQGKTAWKIIFHF